MDRMKDAFGNAYLEANKKRRPNHNEVRLILERDDGYITSIPAGPFFKTYKDWSDNNKRAMDFVEGKVLDIGCGAGKHTLYLQNNNFNAIGIDNSPMAIKVCKERGESEKFINIDKQDLHKLNMNFDTIMLLGNNFGLVEKPEKISQFFKRLNKITSKNATILAESSVPDGKELFKKGYLQENISKNRARGQLVYRARFKKYKTDWQEYLYMNHNEMKNAIDKKTMWSVDKVIFSDSEKNHHTAVIKKP